MTFIAPLALAANAANQQHNNYVADPIEVGFKQYGNSPAEARINVVRSVLDFAFDDESMDSDVVGGYVSQVAESVVDTVTSTGLSQVSESLLYRAALRHVEYEGIKLYSGITDGLLNAYLATSKDMSRRNTKKLLSSHTVVDFPWYVPDPNDAKYPERTRMFDRFWNLFEVTTTNNSWPEVSGQYATASVVGPKRDFLRESQKTDEHQPTDVVVAVEHTLADLGNFVQENAFAAQSLIARIRATYPSYRR